jgi:hypothetical protein
MALATIVERKEKPLKLSERLKMLVGHDIQINTTIESGEMNIPIVILDEVGDDYIEVNVSHSKFGSSGKEQKIISMSHIIDFVHRPGCAKCDSEKTI